MRSRAPLAVALFGLAAGGLGCAREGAAPPPATSRASVESPGGMVRLPGGFFRAGELVGPRSDEIAYHRVGTFLIDATEVTVAEYAACARAGKCRPASATAEYEGLRTKDREAASAFCNRDREDRADHPVNCVDWNDARAYCAFVGKRLPSEEEFEWAARGNERATRYPWGNEAPGPRACWSGDGNDTGGRRPGACPVAAHPEGDAPGGIHDLAGNVWEWTSSATVFGADSRGRGGTPVKIARGGGWSDSDPWKLTAAVRFVDLPTRRAADLGFRCARRE
jgi:formylglycine-generating enzyme required for sulfatase activity